MARPGVDIAGQRFGRLVAIEKVDGTAGRSKWRCRCDCGNERVVFAHNLISAATTGCGCQRGRNKPVTIYESTGVTNKKFRKDAALDLAKALGLARRK